MGNLGLTCETTQSTLSLTHFVSRFGPEARLSQEKSATVWLCETISVGSQDSCWAITQLEKTIIDLYQLVQSDQNVEVKLLLHAAVCIKGTNNLHLHTATCSDNFIAA